MGFYFSARSVHLTLKFSGPEAFLHDRFALFILFP